ncbi:MAG: pyridoxamine 5'-phosphate oxidase family protein [Clostridia bacterium]|nr:pyridoxamine 5'-phosphate oxidase family protein [Clostridia bacterium]
MRRKEKEVTDKTEIESILHEADVLRLAMCDQNLPYMVPMNFGYKDNTFYLHAAREGKKIDILQNNPQVCFEVDIRHELVTGELACNWGMKYKSVIGFGKAYFIEDFSAKKQALDIIMEKYSGKSSFQYAEKAIESICIIKIEIDHMTGKKSGY